MNTENAPEKGGGSVTVEVPIPLLDTLERLDRQILEAGDIPRRWTVTFTRSLAQKHPAIIAELTHIRAYRGSPIIYPEQPAGFSDDWPMIRVDLNGDHFQVSRYITGECYRDSIRIPLDMYL